MHLWGKKPVISVSWWHCWKAKECMGVCKAWQNKPWLYECFCFRNIQGVDYIILNGRGWNEKRHFYSKKRHHCGTRAYTSLLKISFKGVSFTRNTICPSRIFLERFLRTHWRGKAEIKERKQRRWTRQHPCSSAEPPSAAVGEHTVCCGLQTEGERATE